MKRLLLILLLMASGLTAFAQNSTQGKEFWFSFMQNGYKENDGTWVETQVMVSAKRACSGTITNPRTAWSMPFTVGDESVVVMSIPEDQGYNENNEGIPSDFGLLLTATDTVSVFIANCATNSFDASFVLPVESLGSDYIVQCGPQSSTEAWPGGFLDQQTSAFLIVATEDNTVVNINPSQVTMDGHEVAVNYSVTLDRGQTYSMRTPPDNHHFIFGKDFSGTRISARNGKKIAVFNGNTLTTVPYTSTNGYDHIFEQALSVETWGKHFVVTGSSTRTRDLVKITASENWDDVWCNGVHLVELDKGESYTFWLYNASGDQTASGGSCYIETSKPSVVYLYNTTSYDSAASEEENGDPSMLWIPPVELKINDITFCTFNHENATIDNHYVNIVVDSISVNEVYLDSVLLDVNNFRPVNGNRRFYYAQVEVSHGIHHLSCEWGLLAHVYGFGHAKGYAYCVGANVVDLTSVLFVNGLLGATYHDSLDLCIGENVDFEVRTNYPVLSVAWDFDGTPMPGDITASHTYDQVGDFITKAIVKGRNTSTYETFYDTLTTAVHVRVAGYADMTYVLCNEDSFEFHGETYTESGYYEQNVPNINDCDSVFHLTLDMNFSPNFSIVGDHWPIGGSETYISVNEYAVELDNPLTAIDTVLWSVNCENWRLEPHGRGERCTLYIYSFLEEPVLLHATVVNSCDNVSQEFSIQTSYFGVDETVDNEWSVVAPNPNTGDFTVTFGTLQGQVEVTIYDVQGRQVACKSGMASEKFHWNLEGMPSGLYYVKAVAEGKSQVRKVMINR